MLATIPTAPRIYTEESSCNGIKRKESIKTIIFLDANEQRAIKFPRSLVREYYEYEPKLPELLGLPLQQRKDQLSSHDQSLLKAIALEKEIYRRLEPHDHILHCFNTDVEDHFLSLALMPSGDLRTYRKEHEVDRKLKLTWIREIAEVLAYVHDQRVLLVDVRTPNFLLDSGLHIKLCDFDESELFPEESNMKQNAADGFTIYTDMGKVGAVMLEVIEGVECSFEPYADSDALVATWPPSQSLPNVSSVWLGNIIEKCWARGYESADHLLTTLKNVK